VPCHCTATGKALLAWRDTWREAVLEQPLRSFTDRTMTGPDWLRRELARTQHRGFAVEDREFQVGDSAIPLLDVARGRPVQPLHVTHDGRDLVTFGSTPISSFVTPTAADEH
jgi:DNA-binding IclR family transcriptional regulator